MQLLREMHEGGHSFLGVYGDLRSGLEGDETVWDGRLDWDRELLPVFLALLLSKISEYPRFIRVKN